ncbi:cytochrome c biogenesis protein CcdA [Tessaracoccus sp. MC1865]|uniref:cytochrome c biogenesis CcdA family protein n=1 Tax=Tessaracoccus sp. MC1865 TaxID=2760310 RepID=UPI0015FFF327|nr:cytochrome c biogenesis CcdA family protein [Tessaracoccus sp. MC1865]MBB1483614.1 cytochrome c biogenesis protein CcdA [Tessaracoccus sp. MC1865]QTO36693.1 cytochrome c biogenesis protein CcdA [Tessaracoccus sp. MC1865]
MTIGYAGAFLGGIAAILSPCAALVLPAFFAYAFGDQRARLIGRTALFYVGLLLTLVPLGLAAGALGGLLTRHRDTLALVGGIVLILFGLIMALGIRLPIPGLAQRGDPKGPIGAVLLGMTYGLAGACTGPLLGAVLTVAAVGGNAVRGGLLLALFGAGMVVPLVILALLWDRLRLGERLRPRPVRIGPFTTSSLGLVSGLLFIGVGVLFITTDATAGIGGILDATQQFHLESWLREVGLRIPDLAVVGAVVVVAGLLLWGWLRRPTRP